MSTSRRIFTTIFAFTAFICCFSVLAIADMSKIRCDGLYFSGEQYLRFYPDEIVVDVTASGEPNEVAEWLSVEHPQLSKGRYNIKDGNIKFITWNPYGMVEHTGTIEAETLYVKWFSHINGNSGKRVYKFYSTQFPPEVSGGSAREAVKIELYHAIKEYQMLTANFASYEEFEKYLQKKPHIGILSHPGIKEISLMRILPEFDKFLECSCNRIVVWNKAAKYVLGQGWSKVYCPYEDGVKLYTPAGIFFGTEKFYKISGLKRRYREDILYEYWR